MRLHRAKSILVGRSLRTSLGFLAVAAGLFVLGLIAALLQYGPRGPLFESSRLLAGVGAAAVVGFAAAGAYRNEGLLVSLAVATAPALALWLFAAFRAGLLTRRGVLAAVAFALVYGIPMGTVGFALGTEAARWRTTEDDDRELVSRRVVLPLAALAVLAGGALVGYCALGAVSCTLGAVV